MSAITTHVLDTSSGRPARRRRRRASRSRPPPEPGSSVGARGHRRRRPHPDRCPRAPRRRELYRLTFDTGAYFRTQRQLLCFYPHVTVEFEVRDPAQHHHVPLLLSPFGYTTYRGS